MKNYHGSIRLDVFLVEKGYVDSREKAKHLIRSGKVYIGDNIILKTSKKVNSNSNIKVLEGFKYKSRGGYKIDGAVKHFGITFYLKIIADIGCSKGGFTDYALKHGAKKVYAVDVGDELDAELKNDSRAIYLPNTDARKIGGFRDKIDLCLIDVTFLTIESILAVAIGWLKEGGEVLGLIKPPFETGNKLKKVYSYAECIEITNKSIKWADTNGYIVKGLVNSELKGKAAGQQEFFVYLTKK